MQTFHNERKGNLLHWRIVQNDYRKRDEWPSYFVYRVIEGPNGVAKTEYLHRDGQIDHVCGTEGFFEDYAQIGVAFILHKGRVSAAGFKGCYTQTYREWMKTYIDDQITCER
jgi:hypothetical protein